MINTTKKLVSVALFALGLTAVAQDTNPTEAKYADTTDASIEIAGLQISGSVDAYFRRNITAGNEFVDSLGDDGGFYAPGTSFANRNGFSFGMANLVLSKEGEKAGFVADLVFGPRGEGAVFLSGPSNNIVNQLYAYWNVSESVTFTLGNFNTFLGYEVISPVGNFNYSTSYMFSSGPFSHTGLKADFALSDDLSAMVGIMNSTDFTEINFDDRYTVGAQIGFKDQYLNVLFGKQTNADNPTADVEDPTFQIDYTGGGDLSDDFFLGVNATYNTTDGAGFYGAALYPQLNLSDDFAIGLRAEYFQVIDDISYVDITLTGSYEVGDLTIKPEFRLDAASEEIEVFENESSLASFLVSAIYAF